jgi:amino acid adenylation domain-containing protein
LLRPELLHELFERQAEIRPDSVALDCTDQRMTYGELERRANQLARFLRSHGVRRGECVGLWLERSLDSYIALLGILKTGAAYVPLDPDYPAERAGFILFDCRARALVTSRGFADRLGGFNGQVLALDERKAEITAQPGDRLGRAETGTTPGDLCYVIYTSGTTGKPKGVEIEHRSAAHLVRVEGKLFQVQPNDRVYQGFSLAFDASVEEVWLALFAGATLVAGTRETARSGAALSRKLDQARVTVLSCVPTLLAMMEEDVSTVRLLILGGEICPPDLVKRWWRPGRRVFNTYGPTEATVIATCAECHPDEPVTIGQPIPNYLACILDEGLRSVPAGVAGELCLGGIGLARGYLDRPELTREKFISLGAKGGAQRFYRTGDLARWTADGKLEFLGRIDSQVKIRGFRVELAEIEAVLLECPGVQAAAVALREDGPAVQQLVGYVVLQSGTPLDEQAIRGRLRERLPAYMVPALVETLPQLPTLASGKVDRKRLPTPRARPAEDRCELMPPRTALEKQIVAVWEELFSPTPVSLQDDFFFDLGGHSLLVARMVSELRKNPPFRQLSVLDVYQHPTAEKLAAQFEKGKQREGERVPKSGLAGTPALPAEVPFWRHFLCGAAQ